MKAQAKLGAIVLLSVLTSAFADRAAAQSPHSEMGKPGAYSVGFNSLWTVDRSRRFAKDQYGRDIRPIVAFVWYPAEADTSGINVDGDDNHLSLGGYLERMTALQGPPGVRDLALVSREYTLNSFRTYAIDPISEENSDAAKGLQERAMLSPLLAIPDAKPIAGSHPVIIYHPGLGGNILESIGLCEYLASRGHVVVSSTFFHQADWQDRFFCGEISTSIEDIRFLLNHVAASLPFADVSRVGLIGHSFGAQIALMYACQPDNTIDAVVALDTTIDYKSIAQIQSPFYRTTSWHDVLETLTAGYSNCHAAVLNVSGMMPDGVTHPDYAVVKRLIDTRLFLATVNYAIPHESFLHQTMLSRSLIDTHDQQRIASWDRDKRAYNALLEMTGQFFDQELMEGADMSHAFGDQVSVTLRAPVTRPSGDEALKIYKTDGADTFKSLYRSLQSISPRARMNPNPILDDLTHQGDHAGVIKLLEFLLSFESNRGNWRWEHRLGDSCLAIGKIEEAKLHYSRALELCDDFAVSSDIQSKLK